MGPNQGMMEAPGMNNMADVPINAPEPPKENTMAIGTPKKKSHTMLIGMILLAVIAAGGVGFGVWAMLDGNSRADKLNDQISTLQQQNSSLLEQMGDASVLDDGDTIINIDTDGTYANPVIKSDNAEVFYSLGFQSSFILSQDSIKRLSIGFVDGKVSSCNIMEEVDDDGWEKIDECSIGGLEGNIYKIVEFGQGQSNEGDKIGFIMEDGRVAYLGLYDFALSSSANIKGYLNVGKLVTDAIEIEVGNDVAGGYGSTVFVFNDGTFVKYDESMLE